MAFNPALERTWHGADVKQGVGFALGAKVGHHSKASYRSFADILKYSVGVVPSDFRKAAMKALGVL